jgi:hydrogenase maturation protein HypF
MPRLSIQVQGVVQGVGFRPFVFRIAHLHGVSGWVRNRPDGVEIEVQGTRTALDEFVASLRRDHPAPARIERIAMNETTELGAEASFEIAASGSSAETRPSVPADLAICPECAREMDTPGERRHRYPFTNCTYCGPRYSIIEGLPYDRPRTSMKAFPLCADCLREYRDPFDRRFHAQPVACPVCGPHLRLMDGQGVLLAVREAALTGAVDALLSGGILALKGLGGYQLLTDATSIEAIARLRQRKRREEKPFAVMFETLDGIKRNCEVSDAEALLLRSPEAPVLLLKRRLDATVVASVAPHNPNLGAFLPYTPLHRLLLGAVDRPLVCTSGNLSEEPMAIEDADAFERLGGIADLFLIHDRPILRPVDDSVVRLDAHGPSVLRRARGYAPLAHPLPLDAPPILSLGAHQKNTIALLTRGQVVVSQHLGDLHSLQGAQLLERTVEDLLAFFDSRPELLACDLHPDYASTRLAERLAAQWNVPLVRVQHHHAHVAAVMAELGLPGPVLGLAWDGSGFGKDQTLWGGEALRVDGEGFLRIGHLRTFPLPGGDRAVKEPRRSAGGLLWELTGRTDPVDALYTAAELPLLHSMLERGLNTPRTSSIGRLFDAVSALTGARTVRGFEGQAAMELEFAAQRTTDPAAYPWQFQEGECLVADPALLVQDLLADLRHGVSLAIVAHRFHRALAELALSWARHTGLEDVVLCGGCFQNALLVRLVRERLLGEGFQVHVPVQFPANDGAISLGQAWVAAKRCSATSLIQ